jgi:biopolymer transport protein ExbB/TolQ
MESMNISPVAMFLQSGPVGKSVVILLAIASIWCWYQIFDGIISLVRLSRAVQKMRSGNRQTLLDPVLTAGETARTFRLSGESIGEVRERLLETMSREARAIISRLEGGLPNLAVIASVAPFIGLFGTVWGIMASFSAIAASNDTSLAVVAPGIAEALATTAFGLVAAIPASIAYSRLGSAFAALAVDVSGLVEQLSVDLLRGEKSGVS